MGAACRRGRFLEAREPLVAGDVLCVVFCKCLGSGSSHFLIVVLFSVLSNWEVWKFGSAGRVAKFAVETVEVTSIRIVCWLPYSLDLSLWSIDTKMGPGVPFSPAKAPSAGGDARSCFDRCRKRRRNSVGMVLWVEGIGGRHNKDRAILS